MNKFNPRWTNQLWAETTPREKKTKNKKPTVSPPDLAGGSDFSGVTKAQATGTRETPLKCKISAYQSGSEKALKWLSPILFFATSISESVSLISRIYNKLLLLHV